MIQLNSFPMGNSNIINLKLLRRSYSSEKPVDNANESITITPSTNITNDKICQYENIYNITNLELGLARTKSGVSAGLDGEVKANYLEKPNKIKDLSDKLKSQKYKPSPAKKV
jgi:hypothetical protein